MFGFTLNASDIATFLLGSCFAGFMFGAIAVALTAVVRRR